MRTVKAQNTRIKLSFGRGDFTDCELVSHTSFAMEWFMTYVGTQLELKRVDIQFGDRISFYMKTTKFKMENERFSVGKAIGKIYITIQITSPTIATSRPPPLLF